jgi:hypothetical protein
MTEEIHRLREAVVNDCLENLDWGRLDAHLAALTLDEDSARKLIGLIMRARRLVFRYPGNLKKRAAILEGVVAKVRADLGDKAADMVATRFEVFALIDEGYNGLRTMIDGLPLAGLSQAEQVSAYLGHVAREWDRIRSQVDAAGAEGPPVISGVMLKTPEGQRYGADAATSLLVNVLGMNLALAAHKGKWFDADDLVRLPQLPTATVEQIARAGAADGTAFGWQQWQIIEERCRYMGGTLEKQEVTEEDGLPAGAQLISHTPAGIEWEVLDAIANERLGERLGQTFQDMAAMTDLLSKGQGIDPGAAMPPYGYVSPEEVHSIVMLSEYLGTNVATHPADFGGLRLCEWMRGFAVLQQLANDNIEAVSEPLDRAFPRMTIAAIEEVLQRNGLVGPKARIFINHASFAKSSRDIYDAPILRGEGNWCLLAVPALSAALLIRLVLSTLVNKGLNVEDKGEAFEEQFRAALEEEGLPVYHFEVRREGQTYEYDALVPWGSYLFVFECKNRSLSGNNPIASYNLLRSAAGHVEQVQRLAAALSDHPDILTTKVKEDCSSLRIVPVVVSSMPFSMQRSFQGVHFSDIAAINRFFSERYSHLSRLHRVGPHKFIHRVALHDLWSGEKPDADAFMRHLDDSLQLRVMIAHMSVEPIGIQIGPDLYAHTHVPRRQEMTIQSIAAVAGMTAEAIEMEMEQFSEALASVRAMLEAEPGEG